ncbi:YncE family protein [Neobacillus niacini]|uniref:YncE family protein n=1 Tax=Neobacillus niacini TaxID=86668 RepID=UPI00203BDBFA|nr:YncE family protein [Neobacillus niacini]MCM3693397.1 YncE family protein [Neobacillus niacini]
MKKIMMFSLLFLVSIFIAACGTSSDNQTKGTTTEPEKSSQSEKDKSEKEKTAFIYTAEQGAITKVDATSNKTIKTIEVEGSVHNVQISPDGKTLGATVVPGTGGHGEQACSECNHEEGHEEGNGEGHGGDEGEHGQTNGFALFFDAETDQLIKKVEVGSHPAHIVFTENKKYALVTNNEDNNLSVIDLVSYKVIQRISTGKGPHGFRITADSKSAYIANMGENTVSVIDLVGMKESKKIVVGNTPVTTGVTPNGKTLIATLNAENSLAIIDLTTDKVEKVQVGEGPAQVYIQSDGKYAFVANQGTPDKPSDSVSKIELKTKEVVATIKVGKGAHGIVTSNDNQFVYVTNMYENTMSVINNNDNTVIATVNVGMEPNGISIE